jgi:hypothetical protein
LLSLLLGLFFGDFTVEEGIEVEALKALHITPPESAT